MNKDSNKALRFRKNLLLFILVIGSAMQAYCQDTEFLFAISSDSQQYGFNCDQPAFLMLSILNLQL